MTRQRGVTGRTPATSCIQREVIHAHGHRGSNQKSTVVELSLVGMRDPPLRCAPMWATPPMGVVFPVRLCRAFGR
jgi:hypothetical protein